MANVRKDAIRTDSNAIELLVEQHREVEQLIEELSGQSPRGAEFRRTFEELADLIAIHSEIEEKIFYPSVKTGDTGELLEESVLEHLAVKRVLATMMETAPDGDVFAELEELGGLLEAHVIEEEQTLFPKVSQEVDERRSAPARRPDERDGRTVAARARAEDARDRGDRGARAHLSARRRRRGSSCIRHEAESGRHPGELPLPALGNSR